MRFHALVTLHGAQALYAAFPPRPFALLEVRPWQMPDEWFLKYHPTGFRRDTWVYTFNVSVASHIEGHILGEDPHNKFPQHDAAVLPPALFSAFVNDVTKRFHLEK